MWERVRTLTLEKGKARWATFFGPHVVFQPDGRFIQGVHEQTGLVRWQYDAGEIPIRRVLRRGDDAVVVAQDLALMSLENGDSLWSFPLGCRKDGSCQLTPAHLDTRRAVLLGFDAKPNSIVVVDLRARAQAWPGWVQVGEIGRLDADDRMILVSDPTGRNVTAVDPGMGRIRWKALLPAGAGAAGTRPLRMWTTVAGAHIFRALPGGMGPSRIDTLALTDGQLKGTNRAVACSGSLREPQPEERTLPGRSCCAWLHAPRSGAHLLHRNMSIRPSSNCTLCTTMRVLACGNL